MQLYTASPRKLKRFMIAVTNLTGQPPALFRFAGRGWAVQAESLSAAAGQAICRLLASGVRCDRITAPMVWAVLREAADPRPWTVTRDGLSGRGRHWGER